MNFSIIFPTFNEDKIIKLSLKKLCNLNYNSKKFEIIIIDDKSNDDTLKFIDKLRKQNLKININLIKNKKNLGRSNTRLIGAKKAKFEDLVFIDSRCLADKEILNELNKYKYKAIIGNAWIDPNRSKFDKINYLILNKIYPKFSNLDFMDTIINNKNFDKIPKGTGIFYCKKEIFLSSQIDNKDDKNSSDDTKLLKNILYETKIILKSSKFKVQYLNRTSIKYNLNHIYKRGPKFIDYYFNKNTRFFNLINIFIIILIFTIVSLIIIPKIILIYFIVFIILIIIYSIYLSEKFSDILDLFWIFPLIFVSFSLGLIKGLYLKILNKV